MNIEDLTLKDINKLLCISGNAKETCDSPYQIGENYFIRTVTMIQIGKLVKVTEQELVLEDAVWIADTGRFTQGLLNAELKEIELFPKGDVIVGRGSIIDACVWSHNLPKEQK